MSTQTITEDPRKEKGRLLAPRVVKRGSIYIVPSSREGEWHVSEQHGTLLCDCPDHRGRGVEKCKHVWAVEFFLQNAGGG